MMQIQALVGAGMAEKVGEKYDVSFINGFSCGGGDVPSNVPAMVFIWLLQ